MRSMVFGDTSVSMQVLRKPDGMSRGFGFITFKDEMSVEKCLVKQHTLNGKQVGALMQQLLYFVHAQRHTVGRVCLWCRAVEGLCIQWLLDCICHSQRGEYSYCCVGRMFGCTVERASDPEC